MTNEEITLRVRLNRDRARRHGWSQQGHPGDFYLWRHSRLTVINVGVKVHKISRRYLDDARRGR